MAMLTRDLKASMAFVERNFNLTKRYWGWELPGWQARPSTNCASWTV